MPKVGGWQIGPAQGVIAASLCFGLIQSLLMLPLRRGDFFNSYPYISDDGFDWILQGLALQQLMSGADRSVWPTLRSPVYVLISTLDAMFGGGGFILIAAQGLAVALTLAAVGLLALKLKHRVSTVLLVVAALFFNNASYFRIWVLSDTVCIALMTASVCFAIAGNVEPREHRLWIAASVLAMFAGLTQTYGIVPFLIFGGWLIAWHWRSTDEIDRFKLGWLIAAFAGMVVLNWLWINAIAHVTRPSQFELLRLSFNMTSFYAGVWTSLLAVYAPALVWASALRMRSGVAWTPNESGVLAVLLVFMTITYFYQWPESRFTFLYYPLVVVLLVLLCGPRTWSTNSDAQTKSERWLDATAAAVIALGLLVVPGNGYWRPTLIHTQIDWTGTWLPMALSSRPTDRLAVARDCDGSAWICAKVTVPPQTDSPYRDRIFKEYERRIRIKAGPVAAKRVERALP